MVKKWLTLIKNCVFHFLQINLFQPIVLLEEAWRNSAHNSCWFLAKALCCLIQEALKKKVALLDLS